MLFLMVFGRFPEKFSLGIFFSPLKPNTIRLSAYFASKHPIGFTQQYTSGVPSSSLCQGTYCNACMVQTGGGGGEWYKLTSQDGEQTQNICIIFIQCWTNAEDVGPSLYKCYTNILCLLGRSVQNHSLKLYHHTAIASITARAIRHQNIKLPSFSGDM